MITRGEDVEASALRQRGWSISAIARHLGRDRKTVRAHLRGDREAGVRQRSGSDQLGPFVAYLQSRFADNAHIWATALYDEVAELGYQGSYPSFARQLRQAGLRPHCEACAGVKGREYIEIAHPPGEEIQWDWFHRRAPWGGMANILLGTLSFSGKVRGVLAEHLDQAHLIEAMDAVLRRLGGTARVWRTDRLSTVIVPGTRDVQASFAPVAKHYGAIVAPCPPRRGNRKGVVESAVRFSCGRWWRTMGAADLAATQVSFDRFCATIADQRLRPPGKLIDPPEDGSRARWPTVAELAETETLLALPPVPYPAQIEVLAPVGANATVAFRGNRYAVPPGLTGADLHLRHRLGTNSLEIHAPSGVLLASHRLAPRGSGAVVRSQEQAAALERVVLDQFTSKAPCDRKGNYPPGAAARAEAERLLAGLGPEVVVDLGAYSELVEAGWR